MKDIIDHLHTLISKENSPSFNLIFNYCLIVLKLTRMTTFIKTKFKNLYDQTNIDNIE